VITPPAGVKGVTRAGTPFIVLHQQILQTQAKNNTSSLPRRCFFAQQIF
jgi:hypothetical protein